MIVLNDRLTGPTSQELIDQLVRRKPLPTDREAFFRWSWWNEGEDLRIHAVIDRLASDVRRHADALVANGDRTEPCTVLCSADVNVVPVGEVCRMIFSGHFDLGGAMYKTRIHNGRSKAFEFYFDHNSLPRWWESHRHLTDGEIRLLIKLWRIEQEDEFGYPNEQQRQHIHAIIESNFNAPPIWSLRGGRPMPDQPFISTHPQ